MALIKQFDINSHAKIYFWQAIESLEELKKNLYLSDSCKMRFEALKDEQMRCNFLAVRKILELAGYSSDDLYYNSEGKPYLKGDQKISISHSNNCVVVMLSNVEVGIDIERKQERLRDVAPKYTMWELNNSISEENNILKLLKIWTAKESLYKIYGKPGLNLRDQINLKNFFPTDKTISGRIVDGEKISYYNINFIEFDSDLEDYIIAYCFYK